MVNWSGAFIGAKLELLIVADLKDTIIISEKIDLNQICYNKMGF